MLEQKHLFLGCSKDFVLMTIFTGLHSEFEMWGIRLLLLPQALPKLVIEISPKRLKINLWIISNKHFGKKDWFSAEAASAS